MPNRMFAMLCMAFALLIPAIAVADDWVAVKLRGNVLQLVDGEWQELGRGDVVPDDRVIRTLRNGRVEFQRDKETISLAADTQVQIIDRAGERYTTVTQYFGTVEVEAEARQVRHFEVQTPFLAAVVKGTRFIVTSDKDRSSVAVKRGQVDVADVHTGLHALVPAGQTATVTGAGEFALKGRGAGANPILGEDGIAVGAGAVSATVASSAAGGISISVQTPSGVTVNVSPGKGGASVTTPAGNTVGASASAGSGGAEVNANVGNTNVNVGAGNGGVGVGVGKIKLKLL